MINYQDLSLHFFYQLFVEGFANFGLITLAKPLDVAELLRLSQEDTDGASEFEQDGSPEECISLLASKRSMLSEYFCLEFSDDGSQLLGLPIVLKDYHPEWRKVRNFHL